MGRKNDDPKPDIILGGVSIQPNHATLECELNEDSKSEHWDKYTFTSNLTVRIWGSSIFINDTAVKTWTKLSHNDRLIFGSNIVFIFQSHYEALTLEKNQAPGRAQPRGWRLRKLKIRNHRYESAHHYRRNRLGGRHQRENRSRRHFRNQ